MLKFNLIFKIFLILTLIILFGSVPMNIIGKIFNGIGTFFGWIGNALDFFGWGGIF